MINNLQSISYNKKVYDYFSLHGMYGDNNNSEVESVVPDKEKNFIIQFRTWWDFDNSDNYNNKDIDWIEKQERKNK